MGEGRTMRNRVYLTMGEREDYAQQGVPHPKERGGTMRRVVPVLWEEGGLLVHHGRPPFSKDGTHRKAYSRVHPGTHREAYSRVHPPTYTHREAYREVYTLGIPP